MRIPINHQLSKEEVRHRLRTRMPELRDQLPGGAGEVRSEWPHEDCMKVEVAALGQVVRTAIHIEEQQVIVELDLPPMLSFLEPIIAGAVEQQGTKLLAPPKATSDT